MPYVFCINKKHLVYMDNKNNKWTINNAQQDGYKAEVVSTRI